MRYKKYLLIILLLLEISFCLRAQDIQPNNKIFISIVGDLDDRYKKVIISTISKSLNDDKTFTLVERADEFLSTISDEINFQNTGIVSQSNIIETGQQVGAGYVFAVDASFILDELFATSRIIDIEKNIVIASSEYSHPITDMTSLRKFAREIASLTIAELPDNKSKNQRLNEYRTLLNKVILYGPFTSAYKLSTFNAPNGYRIATSNEISSIREAKDALGETCVNNVVSKITTEYNGYEKYTLTYIILSSSRIRQNDGTKRRIIGTIEKCISTQYYYNGDKNYLHDSNLSEQVYIYCIKL